jgi:oxalate decarboxylase/phosphoglucose isomerase-like protein (cupin superfamily)
MRKVTGGVGKFFLLELPIVPEQRGNLTFVEAWRHVPFAIERIYYLYDVPSGATRAGHAHKTLEQVLIAISGSFTVILDDAGRAEHFLLNRPHMGLYIGPMLWRVIENFSSNAVCLALASKPFEEADYYRSYEAFKQAVRKI